MNTYYVHDNGGRPFKVNVDNKNNTVEIFKFKSTIDCDDYGNPDAWIYDDSPVLKYDTLKVFVGKDPNDKSFDGNSLLLKCKVHFESDNPKLKLFEYIFVGYIIFSFYAYEIIDFVSPVGNSDVPYPYAVDINNNTYLIISNVILDRVILKSYDIGGNWISTTGEMDAYQYYYSNHYITPDSASYKVAKKHVPENLYDIKKFYVGNEHYNLTYHPFPDKDYDRLKKDGYLKYKNGCKKLKVFDKESFIKCNNHFGNLMGFRPLHINNIEHKRAM